MLHVVVCNLSSGKIKYVEKEMRRQLGGILRWHREGHQVDGRYIGDREGQKLIQT